MKSRSAFIDSFIEVYGDNTESLAARLNMPARTVQVWAAQQLKHLHKRFPALQVWVRGAND